MLQADYRRPIFPKMMKRTTTMNNKTLLTLYGLKYNPFLSDIPVEALWVTPEMDSFAFCMENLVKTGGFALICAEPGLGKSKILQILDHRLESLGDVKVGVMQRPQSSVADFYREMGDLFGVNLSPANRYGGFKALRQRWRDHVKNTLYKPVLLIDEAQKVLMDQKEQIQLPFEICERISRLESALWDRYCNEFMDIIMNHEDAKSCLNHDQIDDNF